MEKYLAPSLLSADFCNLKNELDILEDSGIKYLHLDVMDGMFVPNISFGIPVIKKIKEYVKDKFVLDTHLMVVRPERYILDFKNAGADILTIHCEATADYIETLSFIKQNKMLAGISINPETDISKIDDALKVADLVLAMSVHPGFGGQKFIEDTLLKVDYLKKKKEENGYKYIIEIDGGINTQNAKTVVDRGVELVVAGSAVFNGDIRKNVLDFNSIINK